MASPVTLRVCLAMQAMQAMWAMQAMSVQGYGRIVRQIVVVAGRVVSVRPLVESPRLSLYTLLRLGIACRPADGGVVVLLASRCNIKQGVHGTGDGWNPMDRRASE
jgi:hypothetical protein